ncbi:gamma-butyrobetaine dioxygenase-like [Ctenocephalides felis]|uniref:gamma-butyrobetaine dioxygenase-like n=1 Tax=Ctenocephalides felis TaxID=7515 RepID=UPI000E6E5B0A|nr:gamma-butyrobetaine dioxygenase-like [Ctenocephalides felis]
MFTHKTEVYKYPYTWLRDNCQCSECFHKGSQSRTLNWDNFDVRIKPTNFKVYSEQEKVLINWSDNHNSTYDIQWLKERNFSKSNRDRVLNTLYKQQKIHWSADEFTHIFQKFQFKDVINEDSVLLKWLSALSQYGVALIENAPITENECRKLAGRINFMRKTHYGEEFEVRARDFDTTSNVAYLSTPLQLHTDLPYYEHVPGTIFLHCMEQSSGKGGENLLADCFRAAEELRKRNLRYYNSLCETVVNWSDVGEEAGNKFHKIHRAPVICKNHDGDIVRINHSVPQRDSYFNIPLENVTEWYEAMHMFLQLVREQTVTIKTKPGDILTIDNLRLVHGRTGYTDSKANTRFLIGAYVDWDEIYSRIRVLQTKQRNINQ